ncbi:MAG: outer membrane protein assembly factor BamA [Nitrospirae bacterium]|nr:outer membrane protein assembly factor BamA [Nitrospirota bacterium]
MSFLTPPANAEEESPIVNELEVRGLKTVRDSAVRARITQDVGETLDYEEVSEDIKAIYEMGNFEDVRVELEPLEDGIKLIYIVLEKPRIHRVDFQGNYELDDLKLKEELAILPGTSSDIELIQKGADRLRKLYEKEGYPLAKVVPVIRMIDEDRQVLTYQIEEGDKVRIKTITIKGNKAISTRKIKRVMKTSKKSLFSFITGSGKYERANIEVDTTTIKDLYFDNGFIQAEVFEPDIVLSEDKKSIFITIEVREGEPYKISSIEFSGNKVFSDGELKEKLKTSVGSTISKRTLNRDVALLTDMYTEKGYALAMVLPDMILDEPKKEARLILRINEDEIYSIGRIEVSGNIRTRDKVIRREILLNEGDTFNSKLIRRSYEKVNNLNLFESLSLSPRLNSEAKTMDIDLSVKERQTGFLSVGAGYSSTDRFVAMVDITQGNLGGRGQSIKLRGEFGSKFTTYELSFMEPWFFDKPVSFTTGIYNTKREYVNYDKTSQGFMFAFGWRFRDYWRSRVSYNFERTRIFNIDETASEAIRQQEGSKVTSSISPSIERDSRDSFLDPHRGSLNAIYLTYAGVGGDNKYGKAVFESSWFFPVTESTTFSIRGTFGYARGLFGNPLPLYERFFVGGIYSVRGLGFGEAGPRDETGAIIGGTRKLILNAEYTFPILEEARLKGVVFYDAGTAYDNESDLRLRQSAGTGIRWISPIGPLRLEWGKNLDPKLGERKARWEFAFGTFF